MFCDFVNTEILMTYDDFLRIILLLFVYFLRFTQLQLYGHFMYSSSSTCHLLYS